MKAIVAVDEKWGIGKNNSLLFSVPEDMKFFRETTTGKIIIVGRKTLQSFPGSKPLKNRTNVVISSSLKVDGAICVNGIEQLMREIKAFPENEVFVCGGASVYKTLLPYCSEALVTKISADGNADAFFPNLDKEEGWNLTKENTVQGENYKLRFCVYSNSNVKSF